MKDSKTLLNQLEPKIAASLNNSAIPAGPAKTEKQPLPDSDKHQLAETINECFELLRINYQHLYFSAYPELNAVNSAKRLWLESLEPFPSDIIRAATHVIVEESDYLPTISRIIKKCKFLAGHGDLPDAHSAYLEACNATPPKQNHRWSHPAVFYAGQGCNWHFLASNEEAIAYPIFKGHYEKLCEQIAQGLKLPEIKALALPKSVEIPLSKEENAKKMAALKQEIGI